ncbi:SDR family oxidoreductase [Brevibacillus choshinensis]|uniref:SDR family oxidoreductase n=1 Tax=Brevibacillus choshinensis TaxID=54911 RepID=A0ABX7FVK0_BRECH|nr:SDR family oxidoreductase [Brevibacillus choshinensis]QRG70279.1 SDR family oxidoreductase [Brevibacillus choshinensis]
MRKNILIIGATSGIAKSIAYQYAKQNHSLILAGRDHGEMERLASDIRIRHRVPVCVKKYHAEAYDEHSGFFASCLEEPGMLGGMILAYGYMEDHQSAQADFRLAKQIIEVNFLSCVSILETAARYFEQERSGFIAVISSVAGDRGRQSNYIYGSSKGALSVYLQGLRSRLFASGVHVVTIKPGFVDTQMTYGLKGLFLLAKPQDAAKKICLAIQKGQEIVYVPGFWAFIMMIIKVMPERFFKRLKL